MEYLNIHKMYNTHKRISVHHIIHNSWSYLIHNYLNIVKTNKYDRQIIKKKVKIIFSNYLLFINITIICMVLLSKWTFKIANLLLFEGQHTSHILIDYFLYILIFLVGNPKHIILYKQNHNIKTIKDLNAEDKI